METDRYASEVEQYPYANYNDNSYHNQIPWIWKFGVAPYDASYSEYRDY